MNPKSTMLLLLSLTTIAFSASAPTEPNDAAAPLSFERNDEVVPWVIETEVNDESVIYRDPGPIRPKHMAKVILPRNKMFSNREIVGRVTSSALIQKSSEAQKEFLAQGFATRVDTSADNVPDHYSVSLYAVSAEDTKIMVRALTDKFAEDARDIAAYQRSELKKYQETRKHSQAALPKKDKQLEQVQKDYEAAKLATYPLNSEEEAAQLARELVLQMDRQAKTLDIDRAGVRGKLEVIGQYLARSDLDNHVIETLEAQRIELLVELNGLEARREAIQQIRDEQHRFCTLLGARNELKTSVEQLKEALEKSADIIRTITGHLKNPLPYMQPPKVYQNKVIIYPVEVADSQN
ncbi:MAG: hypothetical protein JSW27_09595 [Phycisphaerales bacterium]|nr:MAG: hypothetical protein JSW27_09595 [Phycisphaerales bacterium]